MMAILNFKVTAKIWKENNQWNEFLTMILVKIDTLIVIFVEHRLKVADFLKLLFWPLLGLAHTVARGIKAHFPF